MLKVKILLNNHLIIYLNFKNFNQEKSIVALNHHIIQMIFMLCII